MVRCGWRHEQRSIAATVATMMHHSAGRKPQRTMVDAAVQVGIIHFSMTDDSSSDPDFVAPTPDATIEERVPVTENVVPAPADTCTPAAPAGQHVAPAPAITYATPASAIQFVIPSPVIEYVTPSPPHLSFRTSHRHQQRLMPRPVSSSLPLPPWQTRSLSFLPSRLRKTWRWQKWLVFSVQHQSQ